MTISNILLVFTAAATALTSGLFYAWSISVMPGFARLPDREFIRVMRAANRAIQNPMFFAAFFGAPLFLIVSTVFHWNQSPRFSLLCAATAAYLPGTFGVTVFGNVPLNQALDSFETETATDEEVSRQRAAFERRWNNLNHIRAASATIAVILITIACLNSL